jgi:hypothetical protein
MTDPLDANDGTILNEVLRDLPLLDELFLGMQAMNVDLVDEYLEEQEGQLLQEFIEKERTPIPTALLVSALSQMWVFAVYELLRTWRARVQEVLRWDKRLQALAGDERVAAVVAKREEIQRRASEARDAELRWQLFKRADDPEFVDKLRSALNRAEVAYHAVEAVRLTLAKHEVPRRARIYARAPGYGRIDMSNGSIYWQLDLGRNEVIVISRRELADALRALARPNERILPVAIQERVAAMERQSYGINRVTVVLDDGTEHGGVRVAWATEVVGVDGQEEIPFEVARIVDVQPDPAPDEDRTRWNSSEMRRRASSGRPTSVRRSQRGVWAAMTDQPLRGQDPVAA